MNRFKTCGQKIREERKKLKLTQTDLAKVVGVSFGLISKYEKDMISIPANNLKKIADRLNVSMDYLMS